MHEVPQHGRYELGTVHPLALDEFVKLLRVERRRAGPDPDDRRHRPGDTEIDGQTLSVSIAQETSVDVTATTGAGQLFGNLLADAVSLEATGLEIWDALRDKLLSALLAQSPLQMLEVIFTNIPLGDVVPDQSLILDELGTFSSRMPSRTTRRRTLRRNGTKTRYRRCFLKSGHPTAAAYPSPLLLEAPTGRPAGPDDPRTLLTQQFQRDAVLWTTALFQTATMMDVGAPDGTHVTVESTAGSEDAVLSPSATIDACGVSSESEATVPAAPPVAMATLATLAVYERRLRDESKMHEASEFGPGQDAPKSQSEE